MTAKHFIAASILACSAWAGAMPATATAQTAADKGEAKLQQLLGTRTAGQPLSCIREQRGLQRHMVDKTAVIYEIGDTMYVSRPTNASDIRSIDSLQTKKAISWRICAGDPVFGVEDSSPAARRDLGHLQEFVPYRHSW